MKVEIKRFNVKMELKTSGMELDICDNSGNRRGDLVITNTKLIWCQGKTTPTNGKEITWDEFITLMEQR